MDSGDILDVGSYLQEFLSSVDNLPAEMDYLLKELRSKDAELQELISKIVNRQHKMFVRGSLTNIELSASHAAAAATATATATSEEQALREKIKRDLKRADQLADEKCALADRAKELLDRHLTRLDQDLESLYPQHNLIPAGGVTVSPSSSSSPGTQSPLKRQVISGVALTAGNVTPIVTGSLGLQVNAGAGIGPAYPTPYNGRGRTPQTTLKRPRTTSNSPSRPPRLPPGTPTPLPTARNIKLSDPNATLDFLPSSPFDDEVMAAASAAHLGPMVVGVLGDEAPVEHAEDEERYCYCKGFSNGVMIGCDNENCPTEWFHLECVGLEEPPEGTWYCRNCLATMREFKDAQKGRKKRGRPVGS